MKKQQNINRALPYLVLGTFAILLIPLLAMLFGTGVNWGILDFVVVGILLFGSGLTTVLLTSAYSLWQQKLAVITAVGTTLFMIWANLSVGLIGAGPHFGNLMYIGTVAIVVFGIIRFQYALRGLEYSMYTASLSLVLIAVIALAAGLQQLPGSSVSAIIGVNAFFAAPFAVAGLLFRTSEVAPGNAQ